jgi:short-subunit dehydrogenase
MTNNHAPYALITGASSGIGEQLAIQLAEQGYQLILVARRADRLQALKASINAKHSIDIIVYPCDLLDTNARALLLEETQKLDIKWVINNAGFGQVGTFDTLDLAKETQMIQLNIEALHMMTRWFAERMDDGVILNVASMAGFIPTPLMASYAATKAYVINYSRAANYELIKAKRRLRILVLCPGPVETEFAQVAGAKQALKSISSAYCARVAIKGIARRQTVIIPGFKMKIIHFFAKILPIRWILAVSYRMQKRK